MFLGLWLHHVSRPNSLNAVLVAGDVRAHGFGSLHWTDTNVQSRCFGAASAKKRLDVVIRDAINAGDIPGPRYLANGMEMARTDGELVRGSLGRTLIPRHR